MANPYKGYTSPPAGIFQSYKKTEETLTVPVALNIPHDLLDQIVSMAIANGTSVPQAVREAMMSGAAMHELIEDGHEMYAKKGAVYRHFLPLKQIR